MRQKNFMKNQAFMVQECWIQLNQFYDDFKFDPSINWPETERSYSLVPDSPLPRGDLKPFHETEDRVEEVKEEDESNFSSSRSEELT